jgi:hypothetical protein
MLGERKCDPTLTRRTATGEAGIKIATGIVIGEAGIAIVGEAGTVIATAVAGIENDRRLAVETEIVARNRRSETSRVRGTEIGVDLSRKRRIEVETGIEIEIETGTETKIRKANLETEPRTRIEVDPEIKISARISLEAVIKIVVMRRKRKKAVARAAKARMAKIAAAVAMTRRKIAKTRPRKGKMRKRPTPRSPAPARKSTSSPSQSRVAVLLSKLVPSLVLWRQMKLRTSRCLFPVCCLSARRLRHQALLHCRRSSCRTPQQASLLHLGLHRHKACLHLQVLRRPRLFSSLPVHP